MEQIYSSVENAVSNKIRDVLRRFFPFLFSQFAHLNAV